MSIAEKLTTIAENEQRVYEAGVQKGIASAIPYVYENENPAWTNAPINGSLNDWGVDIENFIAFAGVHVKVEIHCEKDIDTPENPFQIYITDAPEKSLNPGVDMVGWGNLYYDSIIKCYYSYVTIKHAPKGYKVRIGVNTQVANVSSNPFGSIKIYALDPNYTAYFYEQSERIRFWDAFQDYGNKTDYENGFRKWVDECYNPKYPIVTSSGSTRANSMFNQSTIVDTKVDITINSIGATHVFYNAASLKTIPKLIVNKDVTYTNWFTYCPKLENITFEGDIGNNINFSDCKKLTSVSLANIVNRLHNHSTSSETHTCTLGSSNLSKISDVFITVATQKGWTLA